MNIPTREECLELLKQNKVPEQIQNHCKTVNKVAVFLAKKLKEKDIDINVGLVDAASLLHDVGRTGEKEKYPRLKHPIEGYNRLKEKYPEIAGIIKVHDLLNVNDVKSWEEKIVNYADKRAWENIIVTMKKRIASVEKRYGFILPETIKQKYIQLEKQIFDIIGIEPDELGEHIE